MNSGVTNIVMEQMKKADWPEVRSIYVEGIETANATFDTEPPSWEEWDRKYLPACRLVVREGQKVIGWAALLPISSKKAYAGAAELSIYLGKSSVGKGIGTKLMAYMIAESEANGFWTLQSGIFPENKGSIRLHEKAGFVEVGVRKRIGKLHGVWRDVVLLERRSQVVGLD
ncbi:GNAT family N-acetyltransferase [Oceanobacillus kapialis]|uniref:GNAT family N-acetyltransferase n=1 Tax=Oceanobacillus kapialis TaxID=481353 RepID=UPI00384C6DA9